MESAASAVRPIRTAWQKRSRSGHAAHVLADLAREAGADLIVAGTHGQGPVAGFFLGGFTIHLLQAASCPVLVEPRDPRGGA